jgi:tagatose-6-phosphate ketose/aldose isomerase
MELLTLNKPFLHENGAAFTAREIASQPDLWNETMLLFNHYTNEIKNFLDKAYKEADNINLIGAGTSAFIGLSLLGTFFRNTKIQTSATATTNIVSNPLDYFSNDKTSLIISFARSGNSPESCAALELADKFSKKCFHLIITCDKKGMLAKFETPNPIYVFVLPEFANDKSLAMTGSYSSMLLTGLMVAYVHQPETIQQQTRLVMLAAKKILKNEVTKLQQIATKDFKRAVFLGSGNLFGTATEAALKLQELTNGKVICKEDTYLGFRHGPKAVVNDETLIVCFLSSNDYVRQYETDLINELKDSNRILFSLAVSEDNTVIKNTDEQIMFGIQGEKINEDFLPVCSILVAQLLGFFKSLELGLSPDNPSINGAISRIVQGVNIYPIETAKSIVKYD